jgi:signal recognition particle receptor subunit beta
MLKFVFIGAPGAGKTTAITAISDIPPISTDVLATDDLAAVKAETTVGIDFGQLLLEDGTLLYLYGAPGQARFSHMWQVLGQGALGLILLLSNRAADPLGDLKQYLEAFAPLLLTTPLVIGVTQSDLAVKPDILEYQKIIDEKKLLAPIFFVDVRKRDDVLLLMDALLMLIED